MRNVLPIPIPKCASNTLERAFGGRHPQLRAHFDVARAQDHYGPEAFAALRLIAVCRNPYRRMFSWWSYRAKDLDRDFQVFLKQALSESHPIGKWKKYYHWTQDQWMRRQDGSFGVHHVLRFERLDEDWRDLFPDRPPLTRDNPSPPVPDHLDPSWTNEGYDLVRSHFAKDFETFGYSPDPGAACEPPELGLVASPNPCSID